MLCHALSRGQLCRATPRLLANSAVPRLVSWPTMLCHALSNGQLCCATPCRMANYAVPRLVAWPTLPRHASSPGQNCRATPRLVANSAVPRLVSWPTMLCHACVAACAVRQVRFAAGISSPVEVLHAVGHGVDLFDNAYALSATASGYALAFPLGPPTPCATANAEPSAGGTAVAQPEASADAQLDVSADTGTRVGADAAPAAAATAAGGDGAGAAGQSGESGSKLNLWSTAYRSPHWAPCSTSKRATDKHHELQRAGGIVNRIVNRIVNCMSRGKRGASVRRHVRRVHLGDVGCARVQRAACAACSVRHLPRSPRDGPTRGATRAVCQGHPEMDPLGAPPAVISYTVAVYAPAPTPCGRLVTCPPALAAPCGSGRTCAPAP
eukprot:350083-Chlamydomonas_euryale.AAC.3